MQREGPAIERWVNERWPQIQAQARQQGRTGVLIDESGVYPLPQGVRTYAPRGQTPVLRHWLTRLHGSVISAITPTGHLYFRISDCSITGEEGVEFLALLASQIADPLWGPWDGASIPKSRLLEEFLSSVGPRVQGAANPKNCGTPPPESAGAARVLPGQPVCSPTACRCGHRGLLRGTCQKSGGKAASGAVVRAATLPMGGLRGQNPRSGGRCRGRDGSGLWPNQALQPTGRIGALLT